MEGREKQLQVVTKKLRIIFKAIQAHSKKVEKECGLSSAKLWMLHEVYANPGLKVSQLATVLSVHLSTCSNMLDKLEEKGLIFRDRSKTDQRSVHLYATEAGGQLLQTAPQPAQGRLSEGLESLSVEHLSSLEKGLDSLVQAIYDPKSKGAHPPH